MTTREVLENARDIVDNKWHQGSYGNDLDGYCILGATCEAARMGLFAAFDDKWQSADDYAKATQTLARHLPDVGWKGEQHLTVFNDSRTTRKEDVLALFDKAIADETVA